jgi:hypothetical protein
MAFSLWLAGTKQRKTNGIVPFSYTKKEYNTFNHPPIITQNILSLILILILIFIHTDSHTHILTTSHTHILTTSHTHEPTYSQSHSHTQILIEKYSNSYSH